MKKDTYVNLNSREVRRAVLHLLTDSCSGLKMEDIRFNNKEHRLYVFGRSVYYYDRHLHYPNKIDHVYAIFEFLQSLLNVRQWGEIIG